MTESIDSGKPEYILSNTNSFERLFRERYGFVCNVIKRYVAEKSKVEDIAQELFTELWTKKDVIVFHTSVDAYLRRMAVSRALNYIRDTKKHNWDELDVWSENPYNKSFQDPSILQKLEEEELKTVIDNALLELPEKCRFVFMMSRHDEMSYSEIAGQLGISIKTVENQIGKALKLLRSALLANRG